MRYASPQLAVNTEAEAPEARAEVRSVPSVHLKAVPNDVPLRDDRLDHFISENGLTFAGRHLILDLWQAKGIDDLERVEQAMREAVRVAGATLLHIHLHHFSPNGGVSGVAVLAESHISIHTWPECGYAALDIFMCGDAQPMKTIPVFRKAFETDQSQITEHKRGVV
jgi:S-adenosylmethionine decarboxylase